MNETAISFDCDWAPDFAIDYTASLISSLRIKSTWFMTHRSRACEKLISSPDVEIGIHPNFLQNSTQGKNPVQIMESLKEIFPTAKAVRTHAMVYSASIAHLFALFDLSIDSSVYLGGMQNIQPLITRYGNKLIVRMPYYWSDDGEVNYNLGWENPETSPGLKILCFHPLHVFLNTDCWNTYSVFRNNFPAGGDVADAMTFVNRDHFGTMNYLIQLCRQLKGLRTLSEIKEDFLSGN